MIHLKDKYIKLMYVKEHSYIDLTKQMQEWRYFQRLPDQASYWWNPYQCQ